MGLTRRELLLGGASLGAAASLSGCAGLTRPTGEQTAGGTGSGSSGPATLTFVNWSGEAEKAAFDALKSAVAPWISPHTTVNFIGVPRSAEQWASAWDADTFAKLAVVRRRYDPERVFPTPY